MSKIIFSSIVIVLYFSWSKSFGFTGAKIVAQSPAKYSVILDHGMFKNLHLGDKLNFYKLLSKNIDKPRYLLIGLGEIVKLSNDRSYIFFKNKISLELSPREIIYYSPNHLNGREDIAIGFNKVVLNGTEESLDEIPKEFTSKVTGDFEEDPVDIKDNNKSDYDVVVRKFTTSKKWKFKSIIGKSAVDVYRPKDINNKNENLSINNKIRRAIINAEQKGIVDKYERQKYGLYGLYGSSIRDGLISSTGSQNTYEKYRRKALAAKKKELINPNVRKNIKRSGARFTNNISDKNLRKYFIETGVKKELGRQIIALNERVGDEIHFMYVNGLSNNTTTLDPINQGLNFAIGISYEYHLVQIKTWLKRFTIQAGLFQEVSNYDVNGINGKFSEANFEMYLSWYYRNSPELIGTFLPYLSLGFKRGTSTVTSINLKQDYKYQVVGLPSFRLGFKYRFKSGDTRDEVVKISFGTNFFLESTKKNLAVVNVLQDNIFGTLVFNEYKVGMGFSVYF